MASLVCEFADKIRFFDQVFSQSERGLFVESNLDVRTGSEVDVEIRFAASEGAVTSRAKVIAKRAKAGPRQQAGVWLQFSPQQAEILRQTLQINEGEGAYITTRGSPRFECALPVLVDKPLRQPFRSKDISQGGICLGDLLAVPVGQTVRMTIEFAENTVVIFGKVVWRRDEASLTGIEFRFQNEEVRQSIAESVRRIAAERDMVVRSKPTVLIVDDDVATLRALERAFATRGYGTLTATSGPEALSVVRQRTPALVLLDVLLPGMNGVEVCRTMKRDIGISNIPVVLTSVLPRDNLNMLIEESGALVGLPKPYRFEWVTTLIDQILDSNRAMTSTPGDDSDEERRNQKRTPIFQRCNYESASLRLETVLHDASEDGIFIASFWGDAPGTKARLTLMTSPEHPVELEVEVIHRIDWGIMEGSSNNGMPGLGLRLQPGASQEEFSEWMGEYSAALADKPVIMVVDDDRSHLDLLALILRNAGYGVITLDTPSAVSNAVALANPALLILDYMMPAIDGATLCKAIKSSPTTGSVPVWLYSSVSDEHLETLARDCGADGFVRKGTRPTEITDRIRDFLAARETTTTE